MVFIVIPAYNPDRKLISLLKELFGRGEANVIVVNDGSDSDTLGLFTEAQEMGCIVLCHAVNLGKGRAIKTAFNYILTQQFKGEEIFAVFADADGQHLVDSILAVEEKLMKNKDSLVMGCRCFDDKTIPFRSRFGNKLTCVVFKLLCGVRVSDTQTGLRGLSGETMRKFLPSKGERFEFEMNMLIEAREKEVNIVEVPISTVYLDENKTSHFNPLKDSLRIYSVFLKFLLSSSLSFVVDLSLFTIFIQVFNISLDKTLSIFPATIIARICSSLINYTINKRNVFNSNDKHNGIILRYYILCVVQLILSALLVAVIYSLIGFIPETAVKVIVDLVLFIISFQIQREWVFSKRKNA